MKSIRILSLESKDIYAAMNNKNSDGRGYNIRNSDGSLNLRKFYNTLDWSLDTIKLKEEYEKAVRRKDFFTVINKRNYSQVVINVTFSYSYKEFNNVGQNVYIRNGFDFKDCVFTDGVCLRDGQLIGIQTNIETLNEISSSLLPPYFAYANGCYQLISNIPILKNRSQLRQELYANGFICDGIKYVRYKRSAGSSRVGKCLFVNEAVAKRMARWDKCGLNIKENSPIDLASYEAYIALPMSSIIDTIEINPENILIVEDYESRFSDKVIAVEEKNDRLFASEKEVEIKNSIWDGESLLDVSMFGKYADKGMLLLRNRFFKTCAFNSNIQKWFADNGIRDIHQLNGYTLAKDITQIKLITTPSSIKYLKFGSIEDWLCHINNTFGIVKHEKETHFFDGRMVQCHYQLLNTLQLSYHDIETLLAPSLKYIGAVREDPSVLRYHIGYAFKEGGELSTPASTKNKIVFKLLGINDKFSQTKIYKEFRDSVVKSFMRNLKRGHVLLNGNYSTLLGNGLELLKQSIGRFNGRSDIGTGNIHTKRFEYGKTILGSRCPHVTMGNVLLTENVPNAEIDNYFNMSKEIVYINSIGENILQRLSGADMDSDTMLLTDNNLLIEAARKNYNQYLVPTNCVSAQKTKRHYNSQDIADLDIKTSVNKIGEIVNLSQQLNSLYWERLASGKTIDDNKELYCDICKLDVLSGIEIDKAKKEFNIDSIKEIEILKRKYHMTEDGKALKPMFFKMITKENGYNLSPNIIYRYFDAPMDYLQRVVSSTNYRQARISRKELLPLMEIIKKPAYKSGSYNALRDKIIDMFKFHKSRIAKAYIGYDEKDKMGRQQVKKAVMQIKSDCEDIVRKMSAHEYLMYLVLKEIEKKENRSIKNLMFEILFGKPDEAFMQMVLNSKEVIYALVEDDSGSETYYDFSFKRLPSIPM